MWSHNAGMTRHIILDPWHHGDKLQNSSFILPDILILYQLFSLQWVILY
jgi:hypothetical protein